MKKRSVSINTRNTLWIEIVFVKTHRQDGQDLEGSTQMLTNHFVGMFACLRQYWSFLLFFWFAGGVTQSSHPPHYIKYNEQKFLYTIGFRVLHFISLLK